MVLPRLLTPQAGEDGVENSYAAGPSASPPLRYRSQLRSSAQDVARVHFNDHIFHLYDHPSPEIRQEAHKIITSAPDGRAALGFKSKQTIPTKTLHHFPSLKDVLKVVAGWSRRLAFLRGEICNGKYSWEFLQQISC